MTDREAMRRAFEDIYRTRAWGPGESASGPGSGRARTALFRDDLALLLRRLRVESILDAGCGDFHWMETADLGVARYVGVDVVPSLIAESGQRHEAPGRSFLAADVTCDPLPTADLVLCRDCLVHLPLAAAFRALVNFQRSGSTWLLATTFVRRANVDIPLGHWHPMNLEAAPFHLPPPVATIDERCPPDRGDYGDKRLGLWRLADLAFRA